MNYIRNRVKISMESIIEIFQNQINISSPDENFITVTKDTEIIADNGMDSLTYMNILLELERQLQFNIDDMILELFDAKTVGDVIRLIEKCMK